MKKVTPAKANRTLGLQAIPLLLAFAFAIWAPVTAAAASLTAAFSSGPGYETTISMGGYVILNVDGDRPFSYTVQDPSIIDVSPVSPSSSGSFRITPKKVGKTRIIVKDAPQRQAAYRYITVVERQAVAAPQLNFAAWHGSGQTLETNRHYFLNPVGGTPPYTFTTSSPSLEIRGSQGGASTLNMVTFTPGAYTVTLRDAAGKTVAKQFVFALNQAVAGLKLAIAPETISVGQRATLTISGGSPPYKINAPANVSVQKGGSSNEFYLTGVTGSLTEPITIAVTDSAGRGGTIRKLVVRPVPMILTVNPQSINVGEFAYLTVSNGVSPMNVTDRNGIVSIAAVSANTFKLTGLKPGAANLEVRDSKNAPAFTYLSVRLKVNINIAPKTVSVGEAATLTISGGKPPYTVADPAGVASITRLDETTYRLTATKVGVADINVRDSYQTLARGNLNVQNKNQRSLTVTITNPVIKLNSPAERTRILTVSGGAEPYNVAFLNAFENRFANIQLQGRTVSGSIAYAITGKMPGHATIVVREASGQTANVAITVQR